MAERFILNILGSASAKPDLYRESSAQLLQAAERLFLIDCSEGTQRRILFQKERVRAWMSENSLQGVQIPSSNKLDSIFISHVHGDHMFGLFPLLNTMGMNNRTKPLRIFGPAALGSILNFYKSFWGVRDGYEIEFTALKGKEPELVYDLGSLRVYALPLRHGVDAYGFLFTETEPLTLNGRPYRPRSYVYISDTATFPELASWCEGVDLMYHEATYMNVDAAKAAARFHSTTVQAARCALDAAAGRLLRGHYSSSLSVEDIRGPYIAEARAVFPDSTAVTDGDIYDLPLRPL